MKRYLAALIASILFVTAVVLWADPAFRYHRRFDFPTRAWSSEHPWMAPPNIDERLMKHLHIRIIAKPSIVVFGNSRSLSVDSALFSPTYRLFNASVYGGSIEDDMAFWRDLKQQNKIPSFVILFLDAGSLNKTYVPGFYNHLGFDSMRYGMGNYWVQAVERDFRVLNDEVEQLYSWPTFMASIDYVDDRFHSGFNYFRRRSHHPHLSTAYLWDGSIQQGIDNVMWMTPQELKSDVFGQLKMGQVYANLNNWELDQDRLDQLAGMMLDMTEHHVHVLIIETPLQPWGYDKLKTWPKYKSLFPAYKKAVDDLPDWPGMIHVCDALDQPRCNALEFIDLIHLQRSCLVRIVNQCTKEAGWSEVLARQ